MANLEKPGTVSAHMGGTEFTDTGTNFYIKAWEGQYRFLSPLSDTTGDSDSYPHFENNGLLYGMIAVRGAMIASQAVGLNNLLDTNKNPVSMELDLGPNRKLVFTAMIERFDYNWNRKAAYVGVSATMKMSDTNPANLEQAV